MIDLSLRWVHLSRSGRQGKVYAGMNDEFVFEIDTSSHDEVFVRVND